MASFEQSESGGDWVPAVGQDYRLKQLPAGWEYQDEDGHYEVFNADGRLIELRDQDGYRQTLEYNAAGLLVSVRDFLGRTLGFEYNAANLIAKLNLPDGRAIKFSYTPQNRLSVVEYQDGSTVKYLYDEASYLGSATTLDGALTGVEDESGARYSSTHYNWDLALDTELSGSLDRYSANYERSNNRTYMAYTAIGLPSGATRKLYLTAVNYKILPRKIITECVDCAPRTMEYAYDTNGRYDVINDNGVTTDYDFDARGLPLQTVEASNDTTGHRRTTQTDWHTSFRVPLESRVLDANDALVAKNTWTYNNRGQTLTATQIDPSGLLAPRTAAYRYCEQADVTAGSCPLVGLLLSEDGARTDVADVTRYVYYPSDDAGCASSPSNCAHRKGDLWKVENALGQTSQEVLRYDGAGRAISSRDINDVVTDYEFNTRGWLAAIKTRGDNDASESDDRIARLDYWPTGLVKKVTLPDGAFASYTYDTARRLTAITNEAGNSIQYSLDSRGNRVKEDIKTASGAITKTFSRVYNLLNELQAVKDASQNATSLTYDSRGNPNTSTDALGRITDQDYDPLNRLIRTLQDANGLAVDTKVKYNARDQVAQVTDPNGLATTYGYNGLGDQTRLESPDTGITDFTYDAAGLLATKKDANDATAHRYTYDVLGRPTAIFYTAAGTADVEYDYDTASAACAAGETFAKGRLSAMRTDGTELQYCYDRFGRVARKVQIVSGKSFTLRYAYNNAGRLQAVTYPDGAVADYTRDASGRIAQVHVTPAGGVRTPLLTGATYQPFGPVAGWTYGNGRTLSRSYDLDYRPKTVFDNASGGLSLGYGYNAVGNLTELKDGLQSTTLAKYDYDALNRLNVTRDGPSGTALETYAYDQTGNRKSFTNGIGTSTYDYAPGSHKLAKAGAITRGYDAVGNTTSIGGTTKEFVYSANDRMKQIKQSGVVTMGYRYNGKGERVAAINNDTGPVTNYALYDEAGHWVGDYDSTGATIQQAIWMDDAPVGLLAGAAIAQSLKYIETDHLGTPRAVIDPTRNMAIWTWSAKGEAFGKDTPNQDPDLDGVAFLFNMRLPGQRFDAGSGLVHNYFRDYDPGTGRYVQSDPIGLSGGISSYSYAYSSPLESTDPFGLRPGDCYLTPDIAAANAIVESLPYSLRNNWEYGSWIYKTKNGYYTYDDPRTSWNTEYVNAGDPPAGLISLGKWHTHAREPYPAKPIRETFSAGDIRIPYGQFEWLGTPTGKILKYSSMGRGDAQPLPQPSPRNQDACDCSAPRKKSIIESIMEYLGLE
ncbi:RHS repeat-associated core domain protein [Lysobacter gummosus]|nr:RHS repeat-associated core domain protein [Lysobacter gummosus]